MILNASRLNEFRQDKAAGISETGINNYTYRLLAFKEKLQELKQFAANNRIEFLCQIKNGSSWLKFVAEIHILEPDTYLDHKRYAYSPEDPEAIRAYAKLGRFWNSLKQHHKNTTIDRPFFYDGILNV